jgi:endonuclease YncB( thermonuclease family)
MRRLPGAALLACGFVLAIPCGRFAGAAPACTLTPIAGGRLQRVVDGRTLVLADGREIRLAGIEVPGGAEAASGAAAAALRQAIGENEIILKQLTATLDRYGRLVAHAFVQSATGEISLARELVAQGQALLAVSAAEGPCVRDLAAAERAARLAKLGLWADPRYELKRAENPAEVLAARGRYALVEGRVLSVRESGSTIYVNFGRRWTEDFTVTIPKRHERLFVAAGLAPQRLQGRRVLIRGVIEERGGPWIEATRAEQIEFADGN